MYNLFNKKALGPVVATSLLIVVAVAALVGFQSWFQTYQSGINSDVETQSSNSISATGIETIVGDTLYFKNSGSDNITITSVKIDGIDCNITGNYSSGMEPLNISICINNVTTSTPDIVVVTNNGILQEKVYLKKNLDSPKSFICTTQGTGFYAGSGTLIDPYEICSCNQLQNMKNNLTASYELISNIDCSDTINWNLGSGFDPIGNNWSIFFEGNLDGNSYEISDLYINRSTSNYIGLFGFADNNVTISNLHLKDINITGQQYVGSVIGRAEGNVKIYNSSTVGGIVKSTSQGVGGLIGFSASFGFLLFGSYSDLFVFSEGDYAGGLISENGLGVINNSYSNSYVKVGGDYVGGIVAIRTGHMYNSFASGLVEGLSSGGAAHADWGAFEIQNVFWDIETTNQLTSDGGTGKNTTEMKTAQTFIDAGWDERIWLLQDGEYPKFLWE